MTTMMNLTMISILNFIYIEIQCNGQFVTLNILTYISGIIGSTTFSQNDILSQQHKETGWIYYLWIFPNYAKKTPVLKKDKLNFDIPESK